MWYVPVRLRATFDVTWRYGWFLGRSMWSDQNYIALRDGTVSRARAIVGLVPSHRWNPALLDVLQGVPGKEKSVALEHIEAEPNPHAHDASEFPEGPDDGGVAGKRRFKITNETIQTYGPSPGCHKCRLHHTGEHVQAQRYNHTEACRTRLHDLMKEAKDPQVFGSCVD